MNKTTRRAKVDLTPPVDHTKTRNLLAFGITGISIVGVVILGSTIIIVNDAGVTQRAQTVLNAVLPLLGTWVGTVLAYFFARENFESASRSVERLTQQLTLQEKFESLPVAEAMVPRSKMVVVKNPVNAILVDVLAQLESEKIKRLPVLVDNNDHPQALIFREGIVDYLYRFKTRTNDERKVLTVQNLLDERPDLDKPYAVRGENDTLADVQSALLYTPECRVVFITRSGQKNDAVIGMITNEDLAKNVQA